jgi:hypothetical protein
MPSSRQRKTQLLTPVAHATLLLTHIKSHKPSLTSPSSLPTFSKIIALGLGKTSSHITQHQIALLLTLGTNIHAYDPVWTEVDHLVLSDLGITVITENKWGKIGVVEDTLFYMPHCGGGLYENVMWANRMDLGRVCVFGNELELYSGFECLGKLSGGEMVRVDDADGDRVGVFNNCAWQWGWSCDLNGVSEPANYSPEDSEVW